MTGRVSYQAGLSAEDIVSRHYAAQGFDERERRWRGPGGEVDLVLSQDGTIVFVEVKKSRDFATAAARITARQLRRIGQSALGYMASLRDGQDSDSRIDVALVDGQGFVEVLENVSMP